MSTRHPSDFRGQFSTPMPKPEIPVRHMPAFTKALWVLALLVLIGIAYSFWRISNVQTPKLDVPPAAQPETPAQTGPGVAH